jgi:hypothetical protein
LKIVLGAGAVIVALYLFWPIIERLLNEGARLAIGGFIFLIACAFAYQAYDGLRSGITGTQPKASKEHGDPNKVSNRVAGIVWGIMALGIAFAALFTLWSFTRP